jgi:hypothetical protein
VVVIEHASIVIRRTGGRQAWFRTLQPVLFAQGFWPGIRDGTITMTFRRWKRRQVVAGNRYRTPAGIVEVETVDTVDPAGITDAEARRSGYASAALLVAELRGDAGLPVYRVAFHRVDEADPREVLANDAHLSDADVATIDSRLERLDRASPHGPWTAAVLDAIAENPGRRAADLAARFERETQPFKTDVRKLKNLGLTLSLEVGYRLSPRGAAHRAATRRRA